MATLTLIERLKIAEAAGTRAGRYEPSAMCPYDATRRVEREAWLQGRNSGQQQREHDKYVEQRRRELANRRARFEAKMQELLGEEVFDELTDWVKELISSETSSHALPRR